MTQIHLGNAILPRRRAAVVIFALIIGGLLVPIMQESNRWSLSQMIPFALAIVLTLIPKSRRAILAMIDRLRDLPPRALTRWMVGVMAVSFILLFVLPMMCGQPMYPRSHDEQMHMVQAQMLAHGRLWMPPIPATIADFFDSFFIITRPVYASVYFPGTALLLVPGTWLGLPYGLLPAILSAAAVGLLFRAMSRLVDPAAGLLGAAMLLANPMFRQLATAAMSHNVMLLLGLLIVCLWLRWMDRRSLGTVVFVGAAAGLAAITRPVEAICFTLPLLLASLPAILGLSAPLRISCIIATIAGAAPFIALQLIFNVGVTGRLLQTPYEMYLANDQPGSALGFVEFDPDAWPQSRLLQKHVYYDQFIRPSLKEHQPANVLATLVRQRVPLLMSSTLPHPILIALLPVGLLGLTNLSRVAFFAILPFLIAAFSFNPFLLSHYLVIWSPGLILLAVLGTRTISDEWPWQRWMTAGLSLMVLASCVAALPGINPDARRWQTPVMDDIQSQLAALPDAPAVVLFRYSPRVSYNEEPVYTTDAMVPDEARIIHAHDLGEENIRLFRYYAEQQPARMFYSYDMLERRLERLGTAQELLAHIQSPTAR